MFPFRRQQWCWGVSNLTSGIGVLSWFWGALTQAWTNQGWRLTGLLVSKLFVLLFQSRWSWDHWFHDMYRGNVFSNMCPQEDVAPVITHSPLMTVKVQYSKINTWKGQSWENCKQLIEFFDLVGWTPKPLLGFKSYESVNPYCLRQLNAPSCCSKCIESTLLLHTQKLFSLFCIWKHTGLFYFSEWLIKSTRLLE